MQITRNVGCLDPIEAESKIRRTKFNFVDVSGSELRTIRDGLKFYYDALNLLNEGVSVAKVNLDKLLPQIDTAWESFAAEREKVRKYLLSAAMDG